MAKLLTFLAAFAVFIVDSSLSEGEKLQIYPAFKTYLLKIGATQELNCSVNTTIQYAKLIWTAPPTMHGITQREETTIYSDTKYFLKFSLTIENFSQANAGIYRCEFKKDHVLADSEIVLKSVEETKVEQVFARDTNVASLSCSIKYDGQVHGLSPTWLKNGIPISELNDNAHFSIDNDTLTIDSPVREDSGLYTASFYDKETMEHKYDCDVEYTAGPLVLDFEKSKNIIEGDDLELNCVVKGYPYVVITWRKNGEIINDSRVQLQDYDGHKNAQLLIRSAEFSDAGVYSCKPYSYAFPNETKGKEITIRVKDRLAALWPFLGIVGEVVVLCAIIFIYEKRKGKEALLEDSVARGEIDGASNKNEGLRHRNTNNPTA
jgi:hypothetical protein